jgi:hypothetical protein
MSEPKRKRKRRKNKKAQAALISRTHSNKRRQRGLLKIKSGTSLRRWRGWRTRGPSSPVTVYREVPSNDEATPEGVKTETEEPSD